MAITTVQRPTVRRVRLGSNDAKNHSSICFRRVPETAGIPIEVILIDGDGNKHQQIVDLKGILNLN
jgi:hypothetical protein